MKRLSIQALCAVLSAVFAAVAFFGAGAQSAEPEPELAPEYQNQYGAKFQLIPSGEFMMGDTLTPEEVDAKWPGGEIDWYTDAHPRHKVTIPTPFYMGVYEVTVGEFRTFVESTRYKTVEEKEKAVWGLDKVTNRNDVIPSLTWKNPGFEQTDRAPVVCVSYEDAAAYVDWLNENLDADVPPGFRYRLPTEAEWEYACRAGSTTNFFWGDEDSDGKGYVNGASEDGTPRGQTWRLAWRHEGSEPFPFTTGYTTTCPVDAPEFKSNPWGLYHMLGNAQEWCADEYYADYYKISPTVAPTGPTKRWGRVVRGGGWRHNARNCRSARRTVYGATYGSDDLGFRVVLARE